MRGTPRWSLWQHNSGDHLLLRQPPCQLPRHHWRMASKTITLNNQTEDMPPRHNTTPSFLTSSAAVDTHISRVHDLSPASTTRTHTSPTVATTANSHHCYALPPYVNTSTSHHHAQKPTCVTMQPQPLSLHDRVTPCIDTISAWLSPPHRHHLCKAATPSTSTDNIPNTCTTTSSLCHTICNPVLLP